MILNQPKTNLKRISLIRFMIILLCVSLFGIASCKKNDDKQPDNLDKDPEVVIKCTHIEYSILEGTIYETKVHIFESNVDGPRLFIMGGTHGDELAGWKAGLELVNKTDWHGTVMLIPQCNILADQLEVRYPGVNNSGMYDGVKYSDLNRSFPGDADGTATQKISNAIIREVENFNPEYAIDLHESRSSASEGRVGETLIFGNNKYALITSDIVYDFNQQYIREGEQRFTTDTNPPSGSFNLYCGTVLNICSYTIETNRNLALERRIEQQLQMLSVIFTYIWN